MKWTRFSPSDSEGRSNNSVSKVIISKSRREVFLVEQYTIVVPKTFLKKSTAVLLFLFVFGTQSSFGQQRQQQQASSSQCSIGCRRVIHQKCGWISSQSTKIQTIFFLKSQLNFFKCVISPNIFLLFHYNIYHYFKKLFCEITFIHVKCQ